MTTVKTAVSLDASLIQRIDDLAKELELPRSRLIARAAEDFLQRWETRRLLIELNRAHTDEPTDEEVELRRRMREMHREVLDRGRPSST